MTTIPMMRVCPVCDAALSHGKVQWTHKDPKTKKVYGPFCSQDCTSWDQGETDKRPPMYYERNTPTSNPTESNQALTNKGHEHG